MKDELNEAASELVAMQGKEPPSSPATALGILGQVLFAHEYESQLETADDMLGPETLYVAMGELENHLAVMKFVSLLEANPTVPGEDPPADILHGTLVLPVRIPEERSSAVSNAIHLANRFMPLGSFCLASQEDGSAACYLQASLLLEPMSDFPVAGAHVLADTTAWALATLAPMISAVAQNPGFSVADYMRERGLEPSPVSMIKLSLPTGE